MLRNNSLLSLIICDIDYFKHFNDMYGHMQVDTCLHTVAQIIKKQAVRPGDFVGRYGGEEFVVVLPDTTLDSAIHIAEKIRMAVIHYCIPHECSSVAPYVTLGLGVSQTMPTKANSRSCLIWPIRLCMRQNNRGETV